MPFAKLKEPYPNETSFFPAISIFLVILSILLCLSLYKDEASCIDRFSLSWDNSSHGTESVYLFDNNGIYYGFLPAYADLATLSAHADAGYSVWLNDVPWQDVSLQTNTEYSLAIKTPWNRTVCQIPFVLMQSQNIPALSIQLFNGSMEDVQQREEETGHMILTDADSHVIYNGDFDKFHIRGNYTATLAKKPYALKFDQEVDLLGSGGYTTYCLVANADDETRLRNKLVYDTAKELGLAYSPESMFVDLYVDNDYYGLYLLADKIDVHENRINLNPLQDQTQALNFFPLNHYDVWSSQDDGSMRRALDIPTDPQDITGGYLLELEVGYRMDDNTNVFISDAGQNVSVKYPEQCSAQQINYIADYYQKVEDSVKDGTYLQYIDLESFVKYYLIEEFFGQIDKTSIFFYKDSDTIDPKLYAGPVWDFDWSFGLQGEHSGDYLSNPYTFYFHWGFFEKLRNNETFRNTLQEVFEVEFYPILTNYLPKAFDYYETQIFASHAMDKCRWDHIYTAPYGPYWGLLHESLASIETWTSCRIDFFQELFLADWEMIHVSFYTDENVDPFTTYHLTPNSYFNPETLVPSRDGFSFAGWYTSNGVPLTKETLLQESVAFYALWEPAVDSGNHTEVSEPETDPVSTHLFKYTSLLDYGILLALATLILFVFVHLLCAYLPKSQRNAKKRSSHDQRTKITP